MANEITLSGTLGQIQPLSIPAASAVEFAGGDVEHLSPTVGLDYRTISNSTRELAYRDNLLAQKVNELITVVNNKEQIISLPTVRTSLVPGEVLVASNYRIPSGYEARVLNGAVASTPSGAILLEVLYSASTFGATDGESVISTYGEVGAATSFRGTGEFVIRMSNVSASPADVTASVFFTLRPAVDMTGGVIGPGIVGEKGEKGDHGDQGEQGVVGPPGPPGQVSMNWRGVYDAGASYIIRDGVSYAFGGTIGVASYINLAASTGVAPPTPSAAPSTNWGLLASGSTSGNIPWGNVDTTPTTAAGYGITGGAQVDSLANASDGMLARSAANTITPRTITAGSAEVVVVNGNGVSGNPTITVGGALSSKTLANTAFTGTTWYGGTTPHYFPNSIATSSPVGGTSALWKLGSKVTASVSLDTTRYIQIDVAGTLYKIGIVV